jgi:hypothetical protein
MFGLLMFFWVIFFGSFACAIMKVYGCTHSSRWGGGRGGGGVKKVRRGERVGVFGKFLVKGWGYPFFGQGERKNGVKLYKMVSFDPF